MLFVGPVGEISSSLALVDYVKRDVHSIAPVRLPYDLQLFFEYLVGLSMGLAVINMVPTFFVDGQWALEALADIFLVRTSADTKEALVLITLVINGLIVAINLIYAFVAPFL